MAFSSSKVGGRERHCDQLHRLAPRLLSPVVGSLSSFEARPGSIQLHQTHKSYGLARPKQRELFKEFYPDSIAVLEPSHQIHLGLDYIRDDYDEMKLFGILTIEKNLAHLQKEYYSDLGKVVEDCCPSWSVVDTLASVLRHKIVRDRSFTDTLEEWATSTNTWKQRISCVSFVPLARSGQYTDIIYRICNNTVKNPERFAQLGTGWVLRELSLCDLEGVKDFLVRNYSLVSREGLRYAVEKMKPKDKDFLVHYPERPETEEPTKKRRKRKE